MKYTCTKCKQPVPTPIGFRCGELEYVAVVNDGVLMRDEFGGPASYYGRTVEKFYRGACADPTCPEYKERIGR